MDYIKHCMSSSGTMSIGDFKSCFCDMCFNSECTRSKGSTSKFDIRTKNWEKIYFTGVQRIDEKNDSYERILNNGFFTVDKSQPYVIQNTGFEQTHNAVDISSPVDVSVAYDSHQEKPIFIGSEPGKGVSNDQLTIVLDD